MDEASLSEEVPWRGDGAVPSLGTLGVMLRKATDSGISFYRGLFITEGNLESVRGLVYWGL
jgi:hypothetical protein